MIMHKNTRLTLGAFKGRIRAAVPRMGGSGDDFTGAYLP